MSIRRLICAVAIASLAACSGGGGSDGGSDGAGLQTDACDVLGLKIINGTQCGGVDHSAVVSYDVFYTTGGATSCSGTLITSTDILTAAHCFIRPVNEVSGITVHVGGGVASASGIAIHPSFREGEANVAGGLALFDDVAIVRLDQPSSVSPIPFATSKGLATGDVVSIFGYGYDEDGNAGALRSGEMLVDKVLGGIFSANFEGEGSNTCQGDSGGPALLDTGTSVGIVGITSSGLPDVACREGDVSIFTDTQDASIRNFVNSVCSPSDI